MPDESFLPIPAASVELVPELTALAERRMLSPAREHGLELRLLGATVLPQRQTIARTQWGTWLFVNHTEDPTARQYRGKIPIPAEQHARLTALNRANVRPDEIWVVHQLDDAYRDGDPLPPLVPTPRHLREKDERLTRRLKIATELFLKGAGATLALAAAVPLLAAGTVASLGAGLDPIILGGVRHPNAPVVMWALLAQWEWE